MRFSKAARYLHLGLTNNCVLACPECARTTADKNLQSELLSVKNLDWKSYIPVLKNYMSQTLPEKRITLCGNWGDPIYYPWILELCHYIKSNDPATTIELHTNGSHRKVEFWKNLAEVLQPNDLPVFSIDGTWETTTQYRRNSDIESIRLAVETVCGTPSGPVTEHKTLLFKYNDSLLEKIYQQSRDLKMDRLRLCWPWREEKNTPGWGTELNLTDVLQRLSFHPIEKTIITKYFYPMVVYNHEY